MGSERAFDFTLSPGELSSCGFLRLFVTSDYIDLGWIQEVSPFDPRFVGTGRSRMLHESLDLKTTSDAMYALTVTLTIAAQGRRLRLSQEPFLRKKSDTCGML
jgi:hypothetical protein